MKNNHHNHYDTIIIGAGAAGLMCAITAARLGKKILVLEKEKKPGKKILMAGGGRCNFTNLDVRAENYISHNPHFCKSALSCYTQWDFIDLVRKYKIPYHEKTLGQLFCNNKSKDILTMLLSECEKYQVEIKLEHLINHITKQNNQFHLQTNAIEPSGKTEKFSCASLVIATGGLSIPTMGASAFAFETAKQFNINTWPTRAGLVPFTLHIKDKEKFSTLSGVSVDSLVSNSRISFRENILFTHRGLSGPAILQISSYWQPGEEIVINLLPNINLFEKLKSEQQKNPKKLLATLLYELLPKNLVNIWLLESEKTKKLADCSHGLFQEVINKLQNWRLKPNNTEGYRTAEVTLGGVDCDELSSKTMETKKVPGLYFIGEAVDVTGWLGGYNFQWAWSSGVAAGKAC